MKQLAIKENHLFSKAYRGGKSCASQTTVVYVLRDKAAERIRRANPEKKTVNRLGISASKKIGGAVQRNRAKRVVRAAYRKILESYDIKVGYLIVISCRTACAASNMQTVMHDIERCFIRLGMIETEKHEGETV